MEDLHDLVRILESKLNYSESKWSHISDGLTPNQSILLDLILEDRHLSDSQASDSMYKMESSLESFRHVKRELKQRLSQLILTYRPSKYHNTAIQVAYYQSAQLLAVVNTLRGLERTQLAFNIAEQLLQKAIKYYFTDVVIEVAQFLSRIYAYNKKTQHKYYMLADLALEKNRIRSYELLAEQAYTRLRMAINDKKGNDYEAGQIALKVYDELSIYETQKIESYKFYISYYLLGIIANEVMGDYHASLVKSELAYQYFQSLHYDHKVAKAIFLNHVTVAQIQLMQLDDAAQTSDQALNYLKAGTRNWAQAYYYLIKIKIMNQEYQDAYAKYHELSSSRAFKELTHYNKGVFQLMGAYLDFLVYINVFPSETRPKKFSFQKFREAYPGFDTDSRGMKITITVLEALYHIMDREYALFESKTERLKEYCARKLIRKSPYHRSSCFIRMLLLIPINIYTKAAVERKAKPYLKRMALDPLKIKERESIAIEIINYEHLWEMVMHYFVGPKRVNKKMRERIELLK